LCILLIILGGLLLIRSAEIREIIKMGSYEIELNFNAENSSERVYINNFILEYDFSRKLGWINFTIDDTNPMKFIIIRFESLVNDFNVTTDNQNFNLKAKLSGSRNRRLDISDFPLEFNRTEISIYFITDMEPKGDFQIFHDTHKSVIYDRNYGIRLILGDNYKCSDICIELLQGVEKHTKSSNEDIRLKFKEGINDNYRFKIDAIKVYQVFWRELFFGLGISLLSSGIVLSGEYFVESKNKRNDIKRNKSKKKYSSKGFLDLFKKRTKIDKKEKEKALSLNDVFEIFIIVLIISFSINFVRQFSENIFSDYIEITFYSFCFSFIFYKIFKESSEYVFYEKLFIEQGKYLIPIFLIALILFLWRLLFKSSLIYFLLSFF